MWFFDAVLEEKPVAATAVPQSGSSDDGAFLLLTDTTPTETAIAPATSDEVMLFDEPATQEMDVVSFDTPAPAEAVVFFDETTAQETASIDASVAMEGVSSVPVVDLLTESTDMADAFVAPAAPAISFADMSGSSSGSTGSSGVKQDPNAILLKAIADLDELLRGHANIAASKDTEIEMQNTRIAEAKAAAKKALEERKKIETEITRVNQMKELFTSQLQK